ncbi:YtpI family protein [Niallia oryzisoli]|uniref:YtpI family protein n=1 Tax=Niallia oryzisoli TaxID=1737571 RepID=A0ABZ2CKH6_9BACI
MPILVMLIVISLAFYLFYKTKYFRTKVSAEKQWISAKGSIALGSFIALFGINQLFLFQTTVTYIVAAVFIILGIINVMGGIKAYKYFLPLAIQELQETKHV